MSFFDEVMDSGKTFFIFTIAIVLGLILLDGITTKFNSSNVTTEASKNVVTTIKNQAYSGFDIAFLVVAIGLIVVSALLSFFKGGNPVFFAGIIIGLVAVMFILVILGAVYEKLLGVSSISLVVSQMTYLPYIMNHLLEYSIIFASVTSISLFSAKREG